MAGFDDMQVFSKRLSYDSPIATGKCVSSLYSEQHTRVYTCIPKIIQHMSTTLPVIKLPPRFSPTSFAILPSWAGTTPVTCRRRPVGRPPWFSKIYSIILVCIETYWIRGTAVGICTAVVCWSSECLNQVLVATAYPLFFCA